MNQNMTLYDIKHLKPLVDSVSLLFYMNELYITYAVLKAAMTWGRYTR